MQIIWLNETAVNEDLHVHPLVMTDEGDGYYTNIRLTKYYKNH